MEIEAALISIARVLKFLASLNPSERVEMVRIEQALQALKTIAFFPSGVLGALKQIGSGEELPRDEAQAFSDMFRVPTQDIRQWLEFLDPSRFANSRRIDILDQMALDSIRYKKLNVRESISRFFKTYAGESLHRENVALEASRVIAQIERLNSEISKAEKMLNRRDTSRPRRN